MYESFYQLKSKPFQLTPNPYFFFDSATHKRALAYLRYGLAEGEGFIVISGDVGTGKSTLLGTLFQSIKEKEDILAIQLNNTQLDADNVLRMVASTLGQDVKNCDKAVILRDLEQLLLQKLKNKQRVVLAVDEAQNLPWESLEELRMMSNLSYQGKSLLQIILLGQPELRDTLAQPELEQLRQRITASCYLSALNLQEVEDYIKHRLRKVGWNLDPEFTDKAFERIFKHTGGIPRRINTLADRILLYGFLENKHKIDDAIVDVVSKELRQELPDQMGAPKVKVHKKKVGEPVQVEPQAINVVQQTSELSQKDKDELLKRIDNLEKLDTSVLQKRLEELESLDKDGLLKRINDLEKEMKAMKKRFEKERDFMRKVVMLSIQFDGEEEAV